MFFNDMFVKRIYSAGFNNVKLNYPEAFSQSRRVPGRLCDPKFVPELVPAPTIHFICTGNIYRSRLAEAYCVSRCARGARVFSSGISAGANGDAPISPWAADVLTRYELHSFAAASWQRTTESLVAASDVLVFMESVHYGFCESWIQPARQRIEVWEIEDVGPIPAEAIPAKAERTFGLIRQRTDALLSVLGLTAV
jgi:protein-tyrosine-phosphatase